MVSKGDKGLFCDPNFDIEDTKLPESAKDAVVAWLRPSEQRNAPVMFERGASRFDINQGQIADSWFTAACASIADHPELIKQVVPEGQKLYGKGYDGSVTFRFWHMGKWETVRIDDRLPFNKRGFLVGGQCNSSPNEFWFPLLEKAYAKIHGGYSMLAVAGLTTEGFISLTGFSVERCIISETDTLQDIFCHLRSEWKHGSLLLCTLAYGEYQAKATGIYQTYTYTITGIETIQAKSGPVRLIRIRNPVGIRGYEWTGPWSDNDKIWKEQTEAVKKQLNYNVEDNGESWMKFSHFLQLTEEIFVARKIPAVDSVQDIQNDVGCNVCKQVEGKWVPQGPLQSFISFGTNQQFLIIAEEADVINSNGYNEECRLDTCDTFIEVMQDYKRKMKDGETIKPPEIGIFVFKRPSAKPMTAREVEDCNQEAMVPFTAATCLHLRLKMEPKVPYVVVPSLRRVKEAERFLLRVFSRKPCIRLQELK